MDIETDLPLVAKPVVGHSESSRTKSRLHTTMLRDDRLPSTVRKQYLRTLAMARSADEWEMLGHTLNAEIEYYSRIAAAKESVRQAEAFYRRHQRWPSDYDPNHDPIREAIGRGGFPDCRP